MGSIFPHGVRDPDPIRINAKINAKCFSIGADAFLCKISKRPLEVGLSWFFCVLCVPWWSRRGTARSPQGHMKCVWIGWTLVVGGCTARTPQGYIQCVCTLVVNEVYCRDPIRIQAVCTLVIIEVYYRLYKSIKDWKVSHFCTTKEWFERNIICVAYFTLHRLKTFTKKGKGKSSIHTDWYSRNQCRPGSDWRKLVWTHLCQRTLWQTAITNHSSHSLEGKVGEVSCSQTHHQNASVEASGDGLLYDLSYFHPHFQKLQTWWSLHMVVKCWTFSQTISIAEVWSSYSIKS